MFEYNIKDGKMQGYTENYVRVAAKYDLMNDLMSFGMHRCWKRYFVGRSAIHSGDNVCDLATGSGDIALLIAKKLADTGKLTISDINPDMLVLGKDKLLNAGFFKNIDSTIANAEQLPFEDNSFDVVTIAFGLRNVADKKKALSEMLRVIKPGGKVMVMEFSQPQLESIEFLYNNKNINSPQLKIEEKRLERDVAVNNQLFLSLSEQFELTKIEQKDNSYPIFTLDKSNVSSIRSGIDYVPMNLVILFLLITSFAIKDFLNNRKILVVE